MFHISKSKAYADAVIMIVFLRETRWKRPDIAPVSGMANVIVGIPTGYVISRDTIELLYRANITGLQRVWFYRQKLVTFFSHVSSVQCSALVFSCMAEISGC